VFAFLAVVVLSLGCAVTNYPVIYTTSGANANAVLQSFYDKAFIVPSGQVATLWPDGSDDLFSEVTQNWEGDQYIYTFDNYDPSGAVMFLDQTYCDPTRQTNCSIVTAWNPDLPDAYPHGDQGSGYNNTDNPFDYTTDTTCQGFRSLFLLLSMSSRLGECGSGIWADKQNAAYEFSILSKVNYRGNHYYYLPIDSNIASFSFKGQDGSQTQAPIYGRFNTYVDDHLRLLVPVSANAKYQLRWLGNFVAAHGNYIQVGMTYGSLQTNFNLNVTTVQNALNRF